MPPKVASPPIKDIKSEVMSPSKGVVSPPKGVVSPPKSVVSPPKRVVSLPSKEMSPPKSVMSPPTKEMSPSKGVFTAPKKEDSPPKGVISPPRKEMSPPTSALPPERRLVSSGVFPPKKDASPPKTVLSPPLKHVSLPKEITSPPRKEMSPPKMSPPKKEVPPPLSVPTFKKMGSYDESNSVAARANMFESASSSPKEVISPPLSAFKLKRTDSKLEEKSFPPPKPKRADSIGKEIPSMDKLTIVSDDGNKTDSDTSNIGDDGAKEDNEESNGVGDKIKKFERAAEDASGSLGRLSRPGSVRGKSRTERLGSDEFPPPATPFKDHVHLEKSQDKAEQPNVLEKQQSINKLNLNKWQRSESYEEKVIKPEPQKIIKPEFKPMGSSGEVTIRSPSLGTNVPDQFPSHGTAFRNVVGPEQARNIHKANDGNALSNSKQCKFKDKKYSVSKGSSYFSHGPEELWLVKKKDIEEIEERVLDSFRRAGGGMCMRSESLRPSSDSGQGPSYAATMGRNKRPMYARSESLDPQWAGARAQTLKRQTSVACTCGHDKKARAKSASPATATATASATETNRPRSRSHGDESGQEHVLDKYETLV